MAFNLTLRKSFLYIFASVGLILVIIAGVSMVDLALKTYVFKKSDYCYNYNKRPEPVDKNGKIADLTPEMREKQAAFDLEQCKQQQTASKQSQASNAIAMLLVGLPLYGYHWFVIRKENQV